MSNGNDMKMANATYSGFLTLLKISLPIIAIITATVILLIS
jgi:hypothetical protein